VKQTVLDGLQLVELLARGPKDADDALRLFVFLGVGFVGFVVVAVAKGAW
jgi:hypothetical protein